MKFNEERALQVFEILEDGWNKKQGIFKEVILPQNRYAIIFGDKKEEANWLFYGAIPMRGGVNSDDPFKWLYFLKEEYPEMFQPKEVALKWNIEKIVEAFKFATKKILNGNGTGKKGGGVLGLNMFGHAKSWYENSKNLYQYWGENILNVYWGVTEFEEAFRRIDHKRSKVGFIGMRRKIFSLLTIWLQEKELIPIFPTPIPVDFHALRVLAVTEIICDWGKPFVLGEKHPKQLSGKVAFRISDKFINEITLWSQKFISRNKLDHMAINPALWVLSRNLCAEHVQSNSKDDAATYIETEDLLKKWSFWPKKYKNPCLFCPVEKFCKWIIPAAPYYRWGLLTKIGERVEYPHKMLPGIASQLDYKSRKNSRK